jgi:shikimate kinase
MKNIFLIGFMGVGKTTIGRKLAKVLNREFLDADEEIEKQTGKTIASIFQEHGEAYFRELEREWLQQLPETGVVVSTGGGMPCFFDNMNTMNQKGLTIYLQRPPAELVHRLKNAKKERPLVKDKTEEELLEFITDLLNRREIYYKKAKIVLDRNHQDVDTIVKLIG